MAQSIRRSVPRQLHDALCAALAQGWEIKRTGGDHLRWIPPDPDQPIVFAPSTPSEYRSINNVIAKLRRSGLEI